MGGKYHPHRSTPFSNLAASRLVLCHHQSDNNSLPGHGFIPSQDYPTENSLQYAFNISLSNATCAHAWLDQDLECCFLWFLSVPAADLERTVHRPQDLHARGRGV